MCAFGLPAETIENRPTVELSQTNGNYEEQRKLEVQLEKREELPNENVAKPKDKAKKSILLLSKQPKNEDNILYCSVDQKQQPKLFRVTVGQSEAAIRCSLQICPSPRSNDLKSMTESDKEPPAKHYYLAFNAVSINLVEDPQRPAVYLYEWNFRNIRRYGCTAESFSIEVGRKSKSGAGLFLFYTLEGATIFQLLANCVNDLKNEVLTGGGLLVKELAADLKCRPISTLINIPPNKYESNKYESKYEPAKYESTKYDSAANSPSSSSTSIKSSSCTSNESNLSDSAQSNSGDSGNFTSLNDQKTGESASLLKTSSLVQQKFINPAPLGPARHPVCQLNHVKLIEKPVLRSTNLLVDRNGNFNEETVKVNTNNPFLASYRNEISNESKTSNEKTITSNLSIDLRPVENKSNDLASTTNGLPNKPTGKLSVKLLSNFSSHQQMNNKLSSCSVVNLIEDQKLSHLNKLNKSLPQINKIGVVRSRPIGDAIGKTTGKTDNQISYSSIISVDAASSFNQPNALAKPPRLSKLLLSGELNKLNRSVASESALSNETMSKLTVEKALKRTPEKIHQKVYEKTFQTFEGETKDEEPIFESRQDLFGFRKEENHYEVADELDEENKETGEKSVVTMTGQVNGQTNPDKQTNDLTKELKNSKSNSLLPIDTYELLVNILNQIDEKSFNTATLKEAIKKAVLTDSSSISNKTEDEFLENLFLSNNNDGEQATINYCVNDCEYAKIMKKKFIKKTIVEHF